MSAVHPSVKIRPAGASVLVVQGDPHAERFYRAAGGVRAGSRLSLSIGGRALPLFTFLLEHDPHDAPGDLSAASRDSRVRRSTSRS